MVVSARPENMDDCANTDDGLDSTLDERREELSTALSNFVANNQYGTLSAGPLVGNVGSWIGANREDSRWLRTAAQAFRDADQRGAALCYATDARINAALAAAGFAGGRTDLAVTPSTATGGPQTTGYADDPVSMASGNFVHPEIDLGFGSTLGWLQLRRTYNSLDGAAGPFGPGWSSWASARLRLTASGDAATLRGPDGQVARVPLPGGEVAGLEGVVGRDGDGGGLVIRFELQATVWRFDAEGRPSAIEAGPGDRVAFTWQGERLVGMAHDRGRSLRLLWSGDRVVGAVTDDGREVTYGYDGEGRLVSCEAPSGARSYEWDGAGRLVAVRDADGIAAVRNTYDAQGRVVAQESPFGRRARFWYRPWLVSEVDDEQGGPTNAYVHDEAGRLVEVIDGHGRSTTTVYDDEGRPLSVTDRRGATTRYGWDDRGRRTRLERPDGAFVELAWDDANRCTSVTGPGGARFRYTYMGDERTPSSIEDPEGGVTTFDVVGGLVRRVVDPDGVAAVFEHDAEGRIVAATDGTGATTGYEWTATGHLAAVTSALGLRTEIRRDAAGRQVGVRLPDGAEWRVERSPAGRTVAQVDPAGARTEVRRGPHGEVVEDVDPTGATTGYVRDHNGSLVGATLPDGRKWTFTHDALLRVVGVTDPAGATWLREHDAEGDLVGTITPTGVHRRAALDPSGQVTAVDDGLTSVAFEHDAAGRPVAQVRPDGTAARVEHDRCGRVVAVTEPGGGVTRFEHSPAGRLVAAVGPAGGRIAYHYDDAGRLREVVDPVGGRRRIRYDADGRVVRVTGPTGEATRYAYDAGGRVAAVAGPDGGVTRFEHDACGRVVAVTGPDGGVTRTTYDAAGRVVSVVDPLGSETRVERDVAGRIVAQIDATGARTAFHLDERDRVVEAVDPLGRSTRQAYDAAGRLVGRVEPDGSRRWWRWDDSDRLAAWGVDGRTVATLHRDVLGRVTAVERDGAVVLTRRWDADGHLVAETVGAVTASWRRDPAGNVVASTLEAPGIAPVTTAYERDAAGRVVAVDDPSAGRIEVVRDAAGRPVRVTGSGLDERRAWSDGRLTRWSRRAGDGPEAAVRLARDPAGRVVTEDRGDGRRVAYRYDAAGQLTGATLGDGRSLRFAWDPGGRLAEEDGPAGHRRYAYDAAGQLARIDGPAGEVTVTHDAAGRRLAEVGPAGERRYDWDELGLLSSVVTTGPDGTSRTRRLDHDALGRLAAVDDTPLAWDPTGTLDGLWAVGDERFVAAAGSAQAAAGPGGAASWLSTRHDGSPAGLDPWGAPVPGGPDGLDADAAGSSREPVLPGELALGHRGEFEVDGLLWLRARAYDPGTRSFLSPDPLAAVTGLANPYGYAANDPVGRADPAGLAPLTDAELRDIRDNWDRGFWDRYGGYIVGGALILGAVAVMFVPGIGPIASGILIGAAFSGGMSAITQQATTGGVNWGQVGRDALIGGAAGGLGAAAGGAISASSAIARGGPMVQRVAANVGENVVGGVADGALNGRPFDPRAMATDALTGGVVPAGGSRVGAPNPGLGQVDDMAQAASSPTSTVYRFHDGTNPQTLHSRLASSDPATQAAVRAQMQDPNWLQWRADQHMQGYVEDSPFVSVLDDPMGGVNSTDPWLRTIATGEPGHPDALRAPSLSRFEVPSDQLFRPPPHNALSLAEGESLVLGDDLGQYRVETTDNPYWGPSGPPAPPP